MVLTRKEIVPRALAPMIELTLKKLRQGIRYSSIPFNELPRLSDREGDFLKEGIEVKKIRFVLSNNAIYFIVIAESQSYLGEIDLNVLRVS